MRIFLPKLDLWESKQHVFFFGAAAILRCDTMEECSRALIPALSAEGSNRACEPTAIELSASL